MELKLNGIATEDIRLDPYTEKRFTFFQDPDGLPLELYEK
jgi:glyoxylase I family protein